MRYTVTRRDDTLETQYDSRNRVSQRILGATVGTFSYSYAGPNDELTAITAAIIGGTNLFGGRGSILGTFIGALIMGVLQNGLNLLAVQSYYQQMAIGAVLILAVWLDRINAQRLQQA